MQNRLFLPQAALDMWLFDGSADLRDAELAFLPSGRRFAVIEAVRVLAEVSGAGDAQELVGRVKARTVLEELGAEIVETSMLLGDAAYDVEPGWVATPVGSFAEFSAARRVDPSEARAPATGGPGALPSTDEALLRAFAERRP